MGLLTVMLTLTGWPDPICQYNENCPHIYKQSITETSRKAKNIFNSIFKKRREIGHFILTVEMHFLLSRCPHHRQITRIQRKPRQPYDTMNLN